MEQNYFLSRVEMHAIHQGFVAKKMSSIEAATLQKTSQTKRKTAGLISPTPRSMARCRSYPPGFRSLPSNGHVNINLPVTTAGAALTTIGSVEVSIISLRVKFLTDSSNAHLWIEISQL